MPVIVSNIRCKTGSSEEEIISRTVGLLRLNPAEVEGAGIYKISLDARKREDIRSVCSVMLRLSSKELEERTAAKNKDVRYFEEAEPKPEISKNKREGRPVIAGFGPAGMFCALMLSEYGYKPIVLERGADVDTRTERVNAFWSGGEPDTETNVQFGEGGAGTFSDGKLTTRINDPLCRYVLPQVRRDKRGGLPDKGRQPRLRDRRKRREAAL